MFQWQRDFRSTRAAAAKSAFHPAIELLEVLCGRDASTLPRAVPARLPLHACGSSRNCRGAHTTSSHRISAARGRMTWLRRRTTGPRAYLGPVIDFSGRSKCVYVKKLITTLKQTSALPSSDPDQTHASTVSLRADATTAHVIIRRRLPPPS